VARKLGGGQIEKCSLTWERGGRGVDKRTWGVKEI